MRLSDGIDQLVQLGQLCESDSGTPGYDAYTLVAGIRESVHARASAIAGSAEAMGRIEAAHGGDRDGAARSVLASAHVAEIGGRCGRLPGQEIRMPASCLVQMHILAGRAGEGQAARPGGPPAARRAGTGGPGAAGGPGPANSN